MLLPVFVAYGVFTSDSEAQKALGRLLSGAPDTGTQPSQAA